MKVAEELAYCVLCSEQGIEVLKRFGEVADEVLDPYCCIFSGFRWLCGEVDENEWTEVFGRYE